MAEIDLKLMNMSPEAWRKAFAPLPDKKRKKTVKKKKTTAKKK